MSKRKVKKFGFLSALVSALLLAACGETASDEDLKLGGEEIEIPFDDAGSTVRSLILAEVLEEAGYKVTLTPVESAGSLYASTSESKDTFNASGWFPSTHKEYLAKYGDELEVYKKTYMVEKAAVSLAVPAYMEKVSSIADLSTDEETAKAVQRTIVGIDPRTGIMKKLDEAIEDNEYGLKNWKLKEGSEQAMIKELLEKYENEQPIIITGWQPHWIFSKLDLKLLEDPQDVLESKEEHINLVFNKKFKNAHPAAYKIATRIADDWKEEDEKNLMNRIFVKGESKEKAVEDFMNRNSNRVDKWKENVEKK